MQSFINLFVIREENKTMKLTYLIGEFDVQETILFEDKNGDTTNFFLDYNRERPPWGEMGRRIIYPSLDEYDDGNWDGNWDNIIRTLEENR